MITQMIDLKYALPTPLDSRKSLRIFPWRTNIREFGLEMLDASMMHRLVTSSKYGENNGKWKSRIGLQFERMRYGNLFVDHQP